jgi:hypothetical protein
VNQIVHKSNARLEQDMAVCVKCVRGVSRALVPVSLCVRYRVPIYITSLGAREDIYAAAHASGGVVLHDIISNAFAQKAIAKGADGLVAVAAGACLPFKMHRVYLCNIVLQVQEGTPALRARSRWSRRSGSEYLFWTSPLPATHARVQVVQRPNRAFRFHFNRRRCARSPGAAHRAHAVAPRAHSPCL